MARSNVVPIRRQKLSPLSVYLETLSLTGRRSSKSNLKAAVTVLAPRASIDDFDWCSLGYEDLVRVRFIMLNQDKSMHTVNSTLAALRSVIKTSFNIGLIDADTMLRATAVKSVRGHTLPRGKALSTEEQRVMCKHARTDKSLTGLRNLTLLYLLLDTGVRREEAAKLNITDYCAESLVIKVQAGKGRKQRQIAVSRRTATLLDRLMHKMGETEGALFRRIRKGQQLTAQALSASGIYDVVAGLSVESGIDRCTPHDMRRTFITSCLDRGDDLGTVSRRAGHADIQTTLVYDRRST